MGRNLSLMVNYISTVDINTFIQIFGMTVTFTNACVFYLTSEESPALTNAFELLVWQSAFPLKQN